MKSKKQKKHKQVIKFTSEKHFYTINKQWYTADHTPTSLEHYNNLLVDGYVLTSAYGIATVDGLESHKILSKTERIICDEL